MPALFGTIVVAACWIYATLLQGAKSNYQMFTTDAYVLRVLSGSTSSVL
jgi:hypothetical protein